VFADDADYLRATARRLRALAAGGFDWRDNHIEVEPAAADTHIEEARKQMLAIAQGYDCLAERAEKHARSLATRSTINFLIRIVSGRSAMGHHDD
jgi:hypothetical protein